MQTWEALPAVMRPDGESNGAGANPCAVRDPIPDRPHLRSRVPKIPRLRSRRCVGKSLAAVILGLGSAVCLREGIRVGDSVGIRPRVGVLPSTCHLLPALCHLPPAACYLLPTACYPRPAICHPPPATCHPPPATCYLLPATRCLPPVPRGFGACSALPPSCRHAHPRQQRVSRAHL